MAYRRPLWYYPLFQIPCLFLGLFLAMALLFWLLGWGKPKVAVAIVLDLSGSTYEPQAFNAPGTIMAQEVSALESYLQKNSSGILAEPNLVQVFGFASNIRPLTRSFSTDAQSMQEELKENMQPSLAEILGIGGTNLDLAVQTGVEALKDIRDRCRELLLVTDGVVGVAPAAITEALAQKVKINAVVIGVNSLPLQLATLSTGGKYIAAKEQELERLFTKNFFNDFNQNWGWILLWLALAWISLMWLLVMPLDRWIFQNLLKVPMNLAAKLPSAMPFFGVQPHP